MPARVMKNSHHAIPASAAEPRTSAIRTGAQYMIRRPDHLPSVGTVQDTRTGKRGPEVYISWVGKDKRLDEWVPTTAVGEEVGRVGDGQVGEPEQGQSAKRRRVAADTAMEDDSTMQGITESHRPPLPPPPPPASSSAPSTPEREHAEMTRVRNFEDVRFGEYLVKTWYYSPYPLSASDVAGPSQNGQPDAETRGKKRKASPARSEELVDRAAAAAVGGRRNRSVGERLINGQVGREGGRGRLWVCDLCFKYMKTRAGWDRHTRGGDGCGMLRPPGRKVYQRGSYTIWEVDGAQATLYCQNLSLFGKLFIDHKSVFFHVENFLFYVLCDAATSQRDQVMAFFSKEKVSFDDYNLACIVTFPPHQNRGFGKLLIEFSYHLTRYPSPYTPDKPPSPGTPERPLSDLGLKGYTAYWIAQVLRYCKRMLGEAEPIKTEHATTPRRGSLGEGRSLRRRESQGGEIEVVDGIEMVRIKQQAPHKGQVSLTFTLASLAKACHLKVDDTAFVLAELGFLQHRRARSDVVARLTSRRPGKRKEKDDGESSDADGEGGGGGGKDRAEREEGEWEGVEVVFSREMVLGAIARWGVREQGMLDEDSVLL